MIQKINKFLEDNNINEPWRFIDGFENNYIITEYDLIVISLKCSTPRILKQYNVNKKSDEPRMCVSLNSRTHNVNNLYKKTFFKTLADKIIFLRNYLDLGPNDLVGQISDEYPCYFAVSDGRILSWKNKLIELKQIENNQNYKIVQLSKDGVKKNKRVHRLILASFVENIDNKTQVDHIDGDRANNNLSNLRWATPSENQSNKILRGCIVHTKYDTYKVRYYQSPTVQRNKTFKTLQEAEKFRLEQQLFRELLNKSGYYFN